MPLHVRRRKDTGTLEISGTLNLPDGTRRRVRQRPQADEIALAQEEAGALQAKILRDAWHGERRGARSFAETVIAYLTSAPRAKGDRQLLNRILVALGDIPLSAVDQTAVDRVRAKMLPRDASPATVRRSVIAPIRAVLRHAARRGWCDRPEFEIPKQPQGRTVYLLPREAERLIAAAAPHLKPLIAILLCTGARLSEALELDWRDVDLAGARIIFWRTKGGQRRVATLPPRAVTALAGLTYRDGPVFRWETKRPTERRDGRPKRVAVYADRDRQGGGQIKKGWAGALRRAGLAGFTPHDCRHSWASWHYALHRDLLRLKAEGGWSSVALVERYAHLMPAGQEPEIRAFWRVSDTENSTEAATA